MVWGRASLNGVGDIVRYLKLIEIFMVFLQYLKPKKFSRMLAIFAFGFGLPKKYYFIAVFLQKLKIDISSKICSKIEL